jgi:hypothetical protein
MARLIEGAPVINALHKEKNGIAHDALGKAVAFERYLQLCGQYAGLQRAIDIIQQADREAEEDDK